MSLTGSMLEGKYEILDRLREGGMGTIYKVRHRLLDEVRVVKVLRPQLGGDEDLSRRFVQEAKFVTRLKHPGIAAVYDFSLGADGLAYIVMEFIDGASFADILKMSGPIPAGLAAEAAIQTLRALSYLHRKRIIHRDVSPDNIMLAQDEDGSPHVKLIDLGIAKALDHVGEATNTGFFMGKLNYASPEQLGGLAPGDALDGRSDLYSLSASLYEMCTGVRPFEGRTTRELIASHVLKAPISFETSDPGGRVPAALRVAILRGLAKNRTERYASADDFADALARITASDQSGRDATTVSRLIEAGRRRVVIPSVPVSTSAQEKLNAQFSARGTASQPSAESEATMRLQSDERPLPVALPSGATAKRRWRMVAVFAATLAGVVVWQVLSRSEAGSASAHRAAAPPESLQSRVPSSLPSTGSPAEPAPAPIASPSAPAPPPAASVGATPVSQAGLRRLCDEAFSRLIRSKSQAEGARAPELAAEEWTRAIAVESDGRSELSRGRYAPAIEKARRAAELFDRAAAVAGAEPARRAGPPAAAALRPVATAVPVSSSNIAVPKTSSSAPAVPTDDERIREVIRLYVRAQERLDADLYVRIRPSIASDRARIEEAFRGLKSQELELENIRVEITGSEARATAREKRTYTPKAGSEQKVERSTVLWLQKSGAEWVITKIQ